jgi:predicted TIM-barrel fold metal-dependent hydrolase
VDENLTSLRDNGIRGVKLHPLFQDVSFADPRVLELLHALAGDGVTVIAHVGAGGSDAANERGNPASLRAAIDAVPTLRLIACHFGGYHRLDEAEAWMVGSRTFLETSWPPRLSDLDRERVVAMIRRHGTDRVVFGSDWPMADPAAELAAVRALGLDEAETAAITGNTLAALLGLAR